MQVTGNTKEAERTAGAVAAQVSANRVGVNHMLTEHEAAEFLRCKVSSLRQWRSRGIGPIYSKSIGVRYRLSDLEAFIDAGIVKPKDVSGGCDND